MPGAFWAQAGGTGGFHSALGEGAIPVGDTPLPAHLFKAAFLRAQFRGGQPEAAIYIGLSLGGWPQMAGVTSLGPPSL